MPYTLSVTFTLANPNPGSYRVKYWPVSNPTNITTVLVSSSPFVVYNLPEDAYAGTIEASCGNNTYSTAQSFSAPTYYYYNVSKFNCSNGCAQVGSTGAFVARSTTSLSLSNGYYYKVGSYTYQITGALTPAPTAYDVSLDGSTSGASCSTVCGGNTGSITFTNLRSSSITVGSYTPSWFDITTGSLSPLTVSSSASGSHGGYVGSFSLTLTATGSGCIILKKNNATVDSVSFSGSGTYTFTSASILSSDAVVIEFANTCP